MIGARSVRSGVGAHLARHAADAGATVHAVLGTNATTAAEAADQLAKHAPRPEPFHDSDALWAHATPDLVIIASPPETHLDYLNRSLTSGSHVLCEKPVAWSGRQTPSGAALARRFQEAGLHLAVHAQWPQTLSTYGTLHPGVSLSEATRFAMHLSPRRAGRNALVHALSHPLSLLAATCPGVDAEVEAPEVRVEGRRCEVRFVYGNGARHIEAHVTLEPVAEAPRPAAYAFDGHWAHREIELPGYAMTLRDEAGRGIPLPDPSRMLVGSVLDRIAAGPPDAVDPALDPGMRHLVTLWRAAQDVDFQPTP